MRREPPRHFCAECQGPLGEPYYDFDDHGEYCADCIYEWIESAAAPKWFLLILHDDIEAGYRRTRPEI